MENEPYLAWLRKTFGLRPAADPAAVLATARAELGERLAIRLTQA